MTTRLIKEFQPAGVKITEREFTAQVTQLARTLGFRVYHPWLSIHSERGFPDLCIVKAGRLIFAELKTGTKLSEKQEDWLAALRETGKCEVFVWYPKDWDDIFQVLELHE